MSEAVQNVRRYPYGTFYLPTAVLDYYDEPSTDPTDPGYTGEQGWTLAQLRESIAVEGLREPLAVGRSVADVERFGSENVLAFNGNHRLAVAREAELAMVPAVNSGAEDALPLTVDEIVGLGGSYDGETWTED
jgi:hypothetical protein